MKPSNKNILFVLGFLLVGFLAYEFSFSRTLELKNELVDLEHKLANNATEYDNETLDTEIEFLDSIITAQNRISGSSMQNSLLNVLNENSNLFGYNIVAFKEPHFYIARDSTNTTKTFEFTLEGNYKNLEEILYILERDFSFGSIAHLSFQKEKDFKRNKFFLQGRVLIQNVK